MRRTLVLGSLLALAACGETGSADAGVDAGARFVPTQTRALGLNDVTWLLPLEPVDAGSAFGVPVELVPFASFDRLTMARPVVRTELSRLRVVALRFDLCDRAQPGPCSEEADGVFRLVLQPVFGTPQRVEDVAFHGFYAVPRAEVPQVVDELRALAALQDVPREAALRVNTTFSTSPEYRGRLVALVSKYAKASRLHRMTLFGQETDVASLIWIFRGEERVDGGPLLSIEVPGIRLAQQEVTLFGGDSYLVSPVADAPLGFSRAMMESSFRAASSPEQVTSVKSLVAVDNPAQHTSNTVQCVSCHVTTTLLPGRAADAGVDVTTLEDFYATAPFDASLLGSLAVRTRTLRALGYVGEQPLTTTRVVNETVHVLRELEVKYPPAAP